MKYIKLIALLLVASFFLVDHGVAQGFGRATFFQLPDYQGRSFVVYGTGSLSNLIKKRRGSTGNWNNKISSVLIEGDMTVSLYDDKDFNGSKITITKSVRNLQNSGKIVGWSNRASSLYYQPSKTSSATSEVIFYENPNYSGRSFVLKSNTGVSDLEFKRRGNVYNDWEDEIESVFIRGSVYVILYEDADYYGESVVLSASNSDLSFIGWRKRASSVLVVPRTR